MSLNNEARSNPTYINTSLRGRYISNNIINNFKSSFINITQDFSFIFPLSLSFISFSLASSSFFFIFFPYYNISIDLKNLLQKKILATIVINKNNISNSVCTAMKIQFIQNSFNHNNDK